MWQLHHIYIWSEDAGVERPCVWNIHVAFDTCSLSNKITLRLFAMAMLCQSCSTILVFLLKEKQMTRETDDWSPNLGIESFKK